MTESKKAELIQLRVEKTFLDKLNRVAEKKNLPLSAMLRVWLSERLSEEIRMITIERKQWQDERLENMKSVLKADFELGPALAVHVHPLTPGVSIDIADIEKNALSLIPWGSTGFSGRIQQHGYELTRSHNGITSAKAQIFKSGQIEGIFAISAENQEILGMALDDGIVLIVSAYVHLLKSQQTPLPYQFNFFILNAKGYSITDNKTLAASHAATTFDSDTIALTPLNIDDWSQMNSELCIGNHCIDMIDEMWRAAGERGSKSYDTNNQWLVRRSR
jgi:hypothetical protein